MARRLVAALVIVGMGSWGCGRAPVEPSAPEGKDFEVKGSGSERGGGLFGFGGTPSRSTEDSAVGVSGSASSGSGTGSGTVPAGVLTAGVWDDNLNFGLFKAYRDGLTQKLADFTPAEQDAAAAVVRSPKASLDVALVIDTTGSMGDEITYLQAEFTAISEAVQVQFPGVPQRWAVIAYRDTTDTYVIKGADFGTSVGWFQTQLNALSASGGGDFPEAPDQALAYASQLSWNPDPDAAHLAFWVADAPPHDDKAAPFSAAVRALATAGVHVYPVASSGIDEATEYAMRATAQLTQGRYVFLTDDSGVGGSHKEPSIPCYAVTHLDRAIVRAVGSELAGSALDVDPTDLVRTVGDPENGTCTLSSGAVAQMF